MLLPVKPKADPIIFPIKGRPILAGTGDGCFTLFVPVDRLCLLLEQKYNVIVKAMFLSGKKREAFCRNTKDEKKPYQS